MAKDSEQDLLKLLERLRSQPRESEWLEFKRNFTDPKMIGADISALANGAALIGVSCAYMVWGVDDRTHETVGTTFDPSATRIQNEELENWLTTQLTPRTLISFSTLTVGEVRVVILVIQAAQSEPVSFKKQRFVRVGSYTKPLMEHPDRERQLWRLFDSSPFEKGIVQQDLDIADVVDQLDYPQYFNLSSRPLPESRSQIIEDLQAAGMVAFDQAHGWSITNMGGLLFARNLHNFPSLERKALRVIRYRDSSRQDALREQVGQRGYAAGFSGLIRYIMEQLPESEIVDRGLRISKNSYPELAIRELVANALIHQDLSMTGVGPMVEVFSDRIEITNPGQPLISPERFVDSQPQSRNEKMARAMRSLRICEERGSGWDKIGFEIEYFQLPAPLIETADESTRIVVFSHRGLDRMDKDDKIRAIYLHACLKWVNREPMTNTTVRQRFGLASESSATASRLIRDAVEAGWITAYDNDAGPRAKRYIPAWAASSSARSE